MVDRSGLLMNLIIDELKEWLVSTRHLNIENLDQTRKKKKVQGKKPWLFLTNKGLPRL